MLRVYLIWCGLMLVQRAGEVRSESKRGLSVAGAEGGSQGDSRVPTWLSENPGFRHPEEVDSTRSGEGRISAAGKGDLGWVVACNEKRGHGIEVELEVSLEPDSEEFLLVAPWPLTPPMARIKLFTGRFQGQPKRLRIPNTKSFRVLYSASLRSSEMRLTYRRYGTSLEVSPPPTDDPVNERKTVFEVQLRGRAPAEYSHPDFSDRFKAALRSIARRYANAHRIPFDDSIPTHQMVLLRRVSFCPFEWPERHVCASLEHSVFVSGVRVPEGPIRDYQLTADHLKSMWADRDLPELAELGVTVYLLPRTSRTVLYWSVIVAVMVVLSLAGSFLLWRSRRVEQASSKKRSGERGARRTRRPKLRLGKRERIPSFMEAEGAKPGEATSRDVKEEIYVRERFREVSEPGDPSQLPIKNYFGSILFGSNRAFEDEEDGPLELRPTPPIK